MSPPELASGALDPGDFAGSLAETLDAGDVASLLLRLDGLPDDAIRRIVERLRPVAQDRGVAVLLNDRPELVAATGVDGIHLGGIHLGDERADLATLRRQLGPDAILGAGCAVSRHRAMTAAEQGADYVAFGDPETAGAEDDDLPSIVAWWSELMTVPCVAFGGATPAEAARLARIGADFVAVDAGIWHWPEGPAAAIQAYNTALAEARPDREPGAPDP